MREAQQTPRQSPPARFREIAIREKLIYTLNMKKSVSGCAFSLHVEPGLLTEWEREIAIEAQAAFTEKSGLDYRTGKYHGEYHVSEPRFSFEAALTRESVFPSKPPIRLSARST
jgi:hypothetical protein